MDRCIYYSAAEKQLLKVLKSKSRSLKTLQGYLDVGCLNACNGYDKDCEYYFAYDKKYLDIVGKRNEDL